MEYLRVTPRDGETFEELTKRLKLTDMFRGSGYYKVTRSEKISANKDMVLSLDDKTRWIAGPDAVRSELKVNKGVAVTLKPSGLPSGCELFVQSTSWNRKLRDGHDVLFRKLSGGSGSGVKVTMHPEKVAKKIAPAIKESTSPNKHKVKDDGNVGRRKSPRKRAKVKNNDESDGGDYPAPVPSSGGDPGGDGIVVWSKLFFDLKEDVDCLDESDLVVGAAASHVPGDCDKPVPNNLLEQAISKVVEGAIRGVIDWRLVEETIVVQPSNNQWGGDNTWRRHQWTSAGTRLLYVESPSTNFIALEMRGNENYGLVCGNCQSHPFCHSPHFMYANSDGSSRDIPLRGLINPGVVLAKLIHDVVLHCQDSEH
ncbi:expressed unknown protein [Seminavis robusta]|uniref:Uncharacterized protein n=1 Tax=Seminavis robusta TaxID=568900 RepID=A0A9N8DZP7_9STRA|nr:expressed unknown protein [Seminavis robusta]|eukprot:Sro369_g128290.1 n/a (368) ;mRNA; f:62890-63993